MSITLIIIIVTVIISFIAFNNEELKYKLSFSPYSYKHNNSWWQILSHGFVHADMMHLLFNMYVLYIFGEVVEIYFIENSSIGILFFLSLYIGGLLFASMPALIKHNENPNYISLGASGAVSSLVFTFILLYPDQPMGIIFIPGVLIPAFIFGALYLLAEHYMNKKSKTNIAHDAHIAGAIFGLIFIGFYDYHNYLIFFDTIANYLNF